MSTGSKKNFIIQRNFKRFVIAGFTAIAMTVITTYTLANAATSHVSIEPESGILSDAQVINDPTASQSMAVTFGENNNAQLPMKTNFPHAFAYKNGQQVKINGPNIRLIGSYYANTICGSSATWKGFKDRGFNSVRLAMDWPSIEREKGKLDPTGLAKLDSAVKAAKDNGLYIILDPIHLKGVSGNLPLWATGENSLDKIRTHGKFYLTEIAKRYKDDHSIIAIDLVNEPHPNPLPFNQNSNLSMFNDLINTVRAVDPDKILIIEPLTGNSGWENADWTIIQNKHNLVVSHHIYFAGGHQDGFRSNNTWADQGNQVYDGISGYPNPNQSQINAHVDKILGWLNPHKLPLYIGEYGIGVDAVNRDLWIQHIVGAMNERNLPRSWWDGCTNEGSMSLYNTPTSTWRPYVHLLRWD
jgi:hypothetical protein